MEASRVIGKDGTKELFRWDWAVIYDLEHSFYENLAGRPRTGSGLCLCEGQ